MFKSFFVNSYPRSGNTWIRLIFLDVLEGKPFDLNPFFTTKFKFINKHRFENVTPEHNIGFVFKSHLKWNHFPQSIKAMKGLYLVRDGRDSLLSYYFYNQKHKGYLEDWDSFFNRYYINKNPINYREKILLSKMGRWDENIKSYLELENTIILKYEDFLQQPLVHTKMCMEFFNIDFKNYESKFEDAFSKSIESLNKKAMRDKDQRKRGSIGAWQDFFSPDQNDRFIKQSGNMLNMFGYLK